MVTNTIQGLNELIKNRLIEKKGNVKLTENKDIILYGETLGISENQLLFKIIEIGETIDWEKENIAIPESFSTGSNSSTLANVIYCSKCNAANDKGVAIFCGDCGSKLLTEPSNQQSQNYPSSTIKKKSKLPIILGASALVIVAVLVGVFFLIKKENASPPVVVPTETIDSNQVQTDETPISETDTTSIVQPTLTLTSQNDALKILSRYYYDINNSNFDATNYFSEYVSQFITKRNITPNDINILFNENDEFVEAQSRILDNRILFERTENNISYFKYWVDYNCYRRSKNKYQFCKVNVEVGFNENNKIVSYKELKVRDLRFEDVEKYN
jgi:hypothetical protein